MERLPTGLRQIIGDHARHAASVDSIQVVTGKIWTVEARGNIMLDVMQRDLNLKYPQMGREIRAAHTATVNILADKGVDYSRLRGALTPRRDRHEIAFVFDSSESDGYDYGSAVHERLLALLPAKDFSCALLSGDLLIRDQDLGFLLLESGLRLHRPVRAFGHTSELFAIYVNNLTRGRAQGSAPRATVLEGICWLHSGDIFLAC